jgi:parallel beta-helix repeat protein
MRRVLFLVLFLTALLGISGVWGTTLNVGAGQTYMTIQAAINAASDGDVIQIDAGTYTEALTVGKSLTFIGAGTTEPGGTILTSTGNVVVLTVANKSFSFQDLIIQGVSGMRGIYAGSTIDIASFTLQNVIVRNCKVGVYFGENYSSGAFHAATVNELDLTYVTFIDNTHIGAYIGKAVLDGTVTGCMVTHNGYSDADAASYQKCGMQFIDFYGGNIPHVVVTNSTFTDNGAGASDIERTALAFYSATDQLSANELMTVSGCTFTDNYWAARIKDAYNVGNASTINGTFTNNYLDIWFNNVTGYTSSTTLVRRTQTGIRAVGPAPMYIYNTIQSAVDEATAGETVAVSDGTYNERITINKQLSILGPDARILPVIDGGGAGTVVTITAAGVVFDGFQVQNSGYSTGLESGILIQGVGSCIVRNNLLTSNTNGLLIVSGDGNSILNNTVNGNLAYGIALADASSNTIQANSVSTIGGAPGNCDAIFITNASNVGGSITDGSTGNYIKGNIINSGHDGIYFDEYCPGNFVTDNNQIQSAGDVGIHMWRIGNQTITGNTITSAVKGIRMKGSSGNTITGNTITGCGMGFDASPSWQVGVWYPCVDNTIETNSIIGNTTGFNVDTDPNQGDVNATRNWWGDATGPYHATTNTGGLGNPVTDKVIYDPWWTNNGMTILSSDPVLNVTQQISYATIQAAIYDADSGDVIQVAAGTYTETVLIDKPLTLLGANANIPYGSPGRGPESIIQPASSGYTPLTLAGAVAPNNVTINGFEITGPVSNYGIQCGEKGASYLDIVYNYIHHIGTERGSGNVYAISYRCSELSQTDINISYNYIDYVLNATSIAQNSSAGIWMGQSPATGVYSNVIMEHNTIKHIESYNGTVFGTDGLNSSGINIGCGWKGTGYLDQPIFRYNTITDLTGNVVYGIALQGNTPGAMIHHNTIDNLVTLNNPEYAAGLCVFQNVGYTTNNGTGIAANYNSFTNMHYGIYNATTNQVDGTLNWWGDPAGPLPPELRFGNAVSEYVTYTPWWQDAAMTTLGYAPVHNLTHNTYNWTIQAAIDAASNGDVIEAAAGTYAEVILVNKEITLLGPNASINPNTGTRVPEAVIQGTTPSGLSQKLEIDAENVVIKGFTFDNMRIDTYNSRLGTNTQLISGAVIENNIFSNVMGTAVYLRDERDAPGSYSTDISVSYNKITAPAAAGSVDYNAGTGILVFGAQDSDILGNVITNPAYNGIQLGRDNAITLTGNTATGCAQPALQIAQWNDGTNTISGNTFSTTSTTKAAIRLYGFTNSYYPLFNVTGNTIRDSRYAIQIGHGDAGKGYNDIRDADYSFAGNTYTNITSHRLIVYLATAATSGELTEMGALFTQTEGTPAIAQAITSADPFTYIALAAPVHNLTQGTHYATIQSAIDAANSGDDIAVDAGTYAENITVTKSLTIDGAGQGSTIIVPSYSETGGDGGGSYANSQVVVVSAHDVTLSNLTVDGNNPLISSGVTRNSVDIDARNGIIESDGPWNNLHVSNVTVKNIYLRGIYARSGGSGFHFDHCSVENVAGGYASIGIFNYGGSGIIEYCNVTLANDAISSNHSRGTQYLYNTITNSGSGIHTDNNGSMGGVADVIAHNNVSNSPAGGYGIWTFFNYLNPVVNENTVTNVDVSLFHWGGAGGTAVYTGNTVINPAKPGAIGLYITTGDDAWGSWMGSGSVSLSNNSITSSTYGLILEYEAGYALTITGGTGNVFDGSIDDIAVCGLGTLTSSGLAGDVVDVWYPGKIQDGIDVAAVNGAVNVAAGEYTEALYIDKDITLTGAGRDNTIVYAPDTLPAYSYNGTSNDLVAIDGCIAGISGFTFNGLGKGNGGGTFNGVHFWEASGSIANCRLTGFRDTPFGGAQDGNAINVNHVWDVNNPQNVNITNNIIDDFQKTGILVNELGSNATISGNTITGQGDAIEGQAAQNGIQVGYGATGSISGNTLSNLWYVPDSWSSAAILIVGADNLNIYENHITSGVEVGIQIGDDDYYGYTGSNNAIVSDNDLIGCDVAMVIDPLSTYSAVTDNTFTDNYIHIMNGAATPNVNTLIPGNDYDNYVIIDQIIYGNGSVIYVEAPKQLIQGSESQTYSVIASHAEDLRGFEVQIKILKEDFSAPGNYVIGSEFSNTNNYPLGYMFYQLDESDADYWIVSVSGSYQGSYNGITGDDIVLFTFDMASLAGASAPAPTGTLVDVIAGSRALLDELNAEIMVAGTLGKLIYIDSTKPEPVAWVKCLTTIDGVNSIDLAWTNPVDAFKNQIWRFNYDDLEGAGAYPTYNQRSFTVPALPAVNAADGWTLVATIDAAGTYVDAGMGRGYYYYAVLVEDEAGNISDNNQTRESISYWPGDVSDAYNPGDPRVVGNDVSLLTANWGRTTGTGMNPIVDVGPSTDYARRSRPCPDGVINIEDMMMFAMNYYNTNYNTYPRDEEMDAPACVTIALDRRTSAATLTVDLRIGDNAGEVRGLNLPLIYGTGLSLASVTPGDVWPEDNLLLYTDLENVVTVSASALGADAAIAGDGVVATLVFNVTGDDLALQLGEMLARDVNNLDVGITEVAGTTSNDDLINVIPAENYLGGNYPNPFNPSTTVQYGLKEAGAVRIGIYNNRGQLIRQLVDDSKAAGTYCAVWDGRDASGRSVSSGMYMIRMEAKGYSKVIKALLVK